MVQGPSHDELVEDFHRTLEDLFEKVDEAVNSSSQVSEHTRGSSGRQSRNLLFEWGTNSILQLRKTVISQRHLHFFMKRMGNHSL